MTRKRLINTKQIVPGEAFKRVLAVFCVCLTVLIAPPVHGQDLFQPIAATALDAEVVAIESADFDGDGITDILMFSQQKFSIWSLDLIEVRFCKGLGTGYFEVGEPDTLIGRAELSEVDIADLNGDGNLDMLLALSGSDKTCAIFVGDGSGRNWQLINEMTAPDGEEDIHMTQTALVDFDRDGDLDFFLASTSIRPFQLMLNNGSAEFEAVVLEDFHVRRRTTTEDFLELAVAPFGGSGRASDRHPIEQSP